MMVGKSTAPIWTSSSSSVTTGSVVWSEWVRGANSVTTSSDSWTQWVTNSVTSGTADIWANWYRCRQTSGLTEWQQAIPAQTDEQRLAQKLVTEQHERERKARIALIEAAKDKAYKLLLSALSDKQKTDLKASGYFHCKSRQGNLYRIYKGSHGNVKRLENGKEIESLCIQPNNVPEADAMLAQKLHIEYNEEEFRKTANITRLRN